MVGMIRMVRMNTTSVKLQPSVAQSRGRAQRKEQEAQPRVDQKGESGKEACKILTLDHLNRLLKHCLFDQPQARQSKTDTYL